MVWEEKKSWRCCPGGVSGFYMHTRDISLQSSVCRYRVFWSCILWHLVSSFFKYTWNYPHNLKLPWAFCHAEVQRIKSSNKDSTTALKEFSAQSWASETSPCALGLCPWRLQGRHREGMCSCSCRPALSFPGFTLSIYNGISPWNITMQTLCHRGGCAESINSTGAGVRTEVVILSQSRAIGWFWGVVHVLIQLRLSRVGERCWVYTEYKYFIQFADFEFTPLQMGGCGNTAEVQIYGSPLNVFSEKKPEMLSSATMFLNLVFFQ